MSLRAALAVGGGTRKAPAEAGASLWEVCGLPPTLDATDARRAWVVTAGREPVRGCGRLVRLGQAFHHGGAFHVNTIRKIVGNNLHH